MIYRYASINDLDEIMGLYKEASLNEWCTWDDSYPDINICKKDIETESLLCLEDNGAIIAAVSFDSDETVDNLGLWNKKYRITACAVAFCETVTAAGYDAAVYGNRWQGYYDYDFVYNLGLGDPVAA